MVKVAWTFKNGVEGAFLISSTLWFSFSLLYDRVQVQCILKMSVPHLKNIYRIMKRGKHLLESIFDPKTHHKTIVMLGVVEHLLRSQLESCLALVETNHENPLAC